MAAEIHGCLFMQGGKNEFTSIHQTRHRVVPVFRLSQDGRRTITVRNELPEAVDLILADGRFIGDHVPSPRRRSTSVQTSWRVCPLLPPASRIWASRRNRVRQIRSNLTNRYVKRGEVGAHGGSGIWRIGGAAAKLFQVGFHAVQDRDGI